MPDDGLAESTPAKLTSLTFELERHYKLTESYFTRLGYYITSGNLFGGDFLLYRATPDTCHAKYLVLVDNSYCWRLVTNHIVYLYKI